MLPAENGPKLQLVHRNMQSLFPVKRSQNLNNQKVQRGLENLKQLLYDKIVPTTSESDENKTHKTKKLPTE